MSYNTWQREALVSYLVSLQGAHTTAEQIERHFSEQGQPLSRTTIYRQLNRLESEGLLRRFATDKSMADCFQYIAEAAHCDQHFHLFCDSCGRLAHIDCSELSSIQAHIASEHDFSLDAAATVFRGTCKACLEA